MGPIISLALMLLLFWVLIVLPQRRRLSAQRALTASLAVGDDVMTTAGLFGTIVELDDEQVSLQVADGVVIRSARWAIARRAADATVPPADATVPAPDAGCADDEVAGEADRSGAAAPDAADDGVPHD